MVVATREEIDAMTNQQLRGLATRIGLSLDGIKTREGILAALIRSSEECRNT